MLCFEDKPSVALHSACGNCANLVCDGCALGWWSQMKPGKGGEWVCLLQSVLSFKSL